MSGVDELARLHDLFVRGAITDEEFSAMKAAVIAGQKIPSGHNATIDRQPSKIVRSGKSGVFVGTGIVCIIWIVAGLVMVVEGLTQYDLVGPLLNKQETQFDLGNLRSYCRCNSPRRNNAPFSFLGLIA